MKFRFTDLKVGKLAAPPKGTKDNLHFDQEVTGLGVRVGAKSVRFLFQKGGPHGKFRKTIGVFPAMNVTEARKRARELSVEFDKAAELGVDLRANRAGKKAEARAGAGYTLEDMIAEWGRAPTTSNKGPRRPNYVAQTVDGLRRAYKPLLPKPASRITLGQLEEIWDKLLEEDLPAAANAAAVRVRTLYQWGKRKKKVPADPTEGADLPAKPSDREHTPTGPEARKIWAAAVTLPAPDGPAILLLQLSVLRLREAIGAEWTEFNDDYSVFSPAPERMKMGQAHLVWLPPVMRDILRKLPRHEGSNLVFTRDGRRGLTGFSGLKKRLDKALECSGVRPFRFHDLRRSAITWMAENGVSSVVADRLLAHTSMKDVSPTASIYNRYKFASERQSAISKWADFLTGGTSANSNSPPTEQAASEPPPIPLTGWQEQVEAVEGLLQAKAEARETVLSISRRRAIHAVNTEIFKRPARHFAPRFLETVGEGDAAEMAIAHLVGVAVSAHEDGISVFKPEEIEARTKKLTEEARRWAIAATEARGEAEQAPAEFAVEANSKAKAAEDLANYYRRALEEVIQPDDVCAVAYRKGDPNSREARARGVFDTLLLLTEEIFGAPEAGIAAAYATAATHVETSRFWARQAVRTGKVGAPRRRTLAA